MNRKVEEAYWKKTEDEEVECSSSESGNEESDQKVDNSALEDIPSGIAVTRRSETDFFPI